MREFRPGAFLKAFIFIFCPALMAVFVWALFQYSEQDPAIYFVVILPVSLAMIALAGYCLAEVVISKFTIAEDRVILCSTFGDRTLGLDSIRGFRQDQHYIRIIPIDPFGKEIKISNYLNGTDQIMEWLVMNYADLYVAEGDEEERHVLRNIEFGYTEEVRRQKLKEARKVSRILNGGAWVLLICLFTLPDYYLYSLTICSLYPLMVIFVKLHYRGLISADEHEGSKMPSAGIAFIVPGMALALRAMMDFEILEYTTALWLTIALIAAIVSVLYMLPSFKKPQQPIRFYGTGLLIMFLNLFYSYGLLVEANCQLDTSEPARYKTTVVDKRVSRGKSTIYYLDLKPWGTLTNVKAVTVTRKQYETVSKGDPLIVRQYAGYLNVPWIRITLIN